MPKGAKGHYYGEERVARQVAKVATAEKQILTLLQDQAEGKRLSFKQAGTTIFHENVYGAAALHDLYKETKFELGHTLMRPLLQRLRKEGKIILKEECYRIGLWGLKPVNRQGGE